jgi:hypothetical protein
MATDGGSEEEDIWTEREADDGREAEVLEVERGEVSVGALSACAPRSSRRLGYRQLDLELPAISKVISAPVGSVGLLGGGLERGSVPGLGVGTS